MAQSSAHKKHKAVQGDWDLRFGVIVRQWDRKDAGEVAQMQSHTSEVYVEFLKGLTDLGGTIKGDEIWLIN